MFPESSSNLMKINFCFIVETGKFSYTSPKNTRQMKEDLINK